MARESQNNGRGRRVAIVLVLVVAAVLLFTGINWRHTGTPVRAEKVVRQEIASVVSEDQQAEHEHFQEIVWELGRSPHCST